MKCVKCQDELPIDGECVTCVRCGSKFHFGCSVRETKWRNMAVEQKSKWACVDCKASLGSSTNNSNSSSINELDMQASKEDDSLKTILQQMNLRLNILDDVKNSVDEMKTSISFLSSKYDELIAEVKEYKEQNKELKREVDHLKVKCERKDEDIQLLTKRLNVLEQYGRGVNLEIHGLDDTFENVEHTLQHLARAINVTYNPADISAAHRVPSRNKDRPGMFLVQFTRRDVKDRWIRAGKRQKLLSKDIGGTQNTRLYFNDNLTPYYSSLFRETRKIAKEKSYESVWVFRGTIKVRKNQSSRQVHTISTFNDLKLL